MTFQAIFTYDPDYEGYVVEIPDLPGCFSQGKTLEEAELNAHDAILGVLHVMEKHGEPYKKPQRGSFVGEIFV